MTLTAAVYYPHTRIRDRELLKSALVLWDHLDIIVPDEYFPLTMGEPTADAALELVARPRLPTDSERQQVHDQILELVNGEIPSWLEIPLDEESRYLVYPQKLLPETWETLQQSELAQRQGGAGAFEDYAMSKWLGLTMMSALATACAGSTKHLVTDQHTAYESLSRYVLADNQGSLHDDSRPPSGDEHRLVSLSLRTLGFRDIELGALVDLRRREDGFLRQLRHKYLHHIDETVTELHTARHAGDREEIERRFEQSLHDELTELNRALGRNAGSIALSQEVLVACVAAVGAMALPAAGIIAIGALGKALLGYRKSREEIMQRHTVSWLYQLRPKLLH